MTNNHNGIGVSFTKKERKGFPLKNPLSKRKKENPSDGTEK
jgi:hypothetical protein